jgi:hypothetical protein
MDTSTCYESGNVLPEGFTNQDMIALAAFTIFTPRSLSLASATLGSASGVQKNLILLFQGVMLVVMLQLVPFASQ